MLSEDSLLDSLFDELVNVYGYDRDGIVTRHEVSKGRIADAVVFESAQRREAIIVIEAKQKIMYPLSAEQLASYMRLSKAKYGILTDGVRRHYFRLSGDDVQEVSDVPHSGQRDETVVKSSDVWLDFALENAYNAIQGIPRRISGEKDVLQMRLDPMDALHELNKILFVSIYLTRNVYPGEEFEDWLFSRLGKEGGERNVSEIFEDAKAMYPGVFDPEETIRLTPSTASSALGCFGITELSVPDIVLSERYLAFLVKGLRPTTGLMITPKMVSDLVVRLLNPQPGESTLIPQCGAGTFLVSILKSRDWNGAVETKEPLGVLGTEVHPKVATCSKINLLLAGADYRMAVTSDFMAMGLGDSLFSKGFEVVAVDPPLGVRDSGEGGFEGSELAMTPGRKELYAFYIEKCLRVLREGGRMAVIVPEFLLSASSMGNLRAFISSKALVKAVVSLPGKAFLPYVSIDRAILLLEKGSHEGNRVFLGQVANLNKMTMDEVIANYRSFLKEEESFKGLSKVVLQDSMSERWDTAFHMSPHYILEGPTRQLGDVAKIFKGVHIPSREYFPKDSKGGLPYIRISDMQGGRIDTTLAKRVPGSYAKVTLEPGDVLLSAAGTIGKAAQVSEGDKAAVPGAQIIVLRPNGDLVEPEFLALVIQSGYVQAQLQARRTGAYISHISLSDVRRTVVPLPDRKVQKEKAAMFRRLALKLERMDEEELGRQIDALLGGSA